MNQLQNAVFEPITVGARGRETGGDCRGGLRAVDTIFPPHVGFSLRIDIGGEGKGGEKGFLFLKEIPNLALWARSEVTSNFGRWKKKLESNSSCMSREEFILNKLHLEGR